MNQCGWCGCDLGYLHGYYVCPRSPSYRVGHRRGFLYGMLGAMLGMLLEALLR